MNQTIFSSLSLAAALSLAACAPKVPPRLDSAQGASRMDRGTRYLEDGTTPEPREEPKPKDEVIDPTPVKPAGNIPPPPTPNNPEYAQKVEGKPGYVKSPYDAQGRLIDVRGLPPGTEAECPYTKRTFLVPP
jgi:hypothetical protein